MAGMKRFQGPGQQWATHGGYYMSTNMQTGIVGGRVLHPVQAPASANTLRLSSDIQTGTLGRIIKPIGDWMRRQAEEAGVLPPVGGSGPATSRDVQELRSDLRRGGPGTPPPTPMVQKVGMPPAPQTVATVGPPPLPKMPPRVGPPPPPGKRSRQQAFGQGTLFGNVDMNP